MASKEVPGGEIPVPGSESPAPHPADLRSYGRKRGRKPSPRQSELLETVLPRVRLDLEQLSVSDLASQFRTPVQEVWLEIGFGGAEHMIDCARRNPTVGLIGAEPFQEGIVKALAAIEAHVLGNVLVHPDDVRPVLNRLPPDSISRISVLYPDPWPKRRHAKRRLMRRQVLARLANLLRPGADLRVATDIGDYAATVLEEVRLVPGLAWTARQPADWRTPWPDWPGTRYEAKALAEGRRPAYLTFVRA